MSSTMLMQHVDPQEGVWGVQLADKSASAYDDHQSLILMKRN
jgi:hypothetical protein